MISVATAIVDSVATSEPCQLPITIMCKYAVENRWIEARLVDAQKWLIEIDTNEFTPEFLRNKRFRIGDFSTHILRHKDYLSLKHWYMHDSKNKFPHLHKVAKNCNFLQPTNEFLQRDVSSIIDFVPTKTKSLYNVTMMGESFMIQRNNKLRTLRKRHCMNPVALIEFEKLLVIQDEVELACAEPTRVTDTAASSVNAPLVPALTPTTLSLEDRSLVMSTEECIKTLFYGLIFLTRTSIPGTTLDSILVIDHYTSKMNPISLDQALALWKDTRGAIVDSMPEAVVFSSTSALFNGLLEWVHMNLKPTKSNATPVCNEITLRFKLRDVGPCDDAYKAELTEQFNALIRGIGTKMPTTLFISSVTILDFVYITFWPFRIVSGGGEHHNFYLPVSDTTVSSRTLSTSYNKAGMWEHYMSEMDL